MKIKKIVATIYNQNWYYQGPVKNGIKEGYCTFIFDDNIYNGPFKANIWERYGCLLTKSGDKFELFKKGKMPVKKKEEDSDKAINNNPFQKQASGIITIFSLNPII